MSTTELAIREGQETFDPKQLSALQHMGVANASRADQAIFFHQCVRTGLDPFSRQIYMIERQGKQTIQTGIDGYRLIARRAADKRAETIGYGPDEWCGTDGVWRDVWLSPEPPAAARVTVLRDGHPFPAVALLSEYRAMKRDGSPMAQWASKPALMLAKCAEALALRRAFPQELSGIYTADEMGAHEHVVREPEQRVTAAEILSRREPETVEDDLPACEQTDDDGAA
jgi:phage recombination protein Bet